VVSRWRVATITFNWQGPWGADALLTKRSVFPSNYVHNGYTRAVNKDAESLLPLPAATFHILVALTGEDRHGYAILKEVSAQTDGSVKLSAATLYRSIERMLEQGLIREVTPRAPRDSEDERRRYYRITALGRAAAMAEARRLTRLLVLARASGLA
jgi:DNA-binding PadR family transcriptional regulator